MVVDGSGVVVGLLRAEELAGDAQARAEDTMLLGPSTYRPHITLAELAEAMKDSEIPSAPITTSDGRLIGLLLAEDAERGAAGG